MEKSQSKKSRMKVFLELPELFFSPVFQKWNNFLTEKHIVYDVRVSFIHRNCAQLYHKLQT